MSTDKTDADLDPSKDKDTDDEAEDDAKDGGRREERRFDTDQKAYTRQEFIDEYGDAWPEHWRLAPKEDDDDEGSVAAGDGDGGAGGSEDKRDEPLVLLPPQCCAKAWCGCTGHYAHLSCFNEMQAAGDAMEDDGEEGGDAAARPSCPRAARGSNPYSPRRVATWTRRSRSWSRRPQARAAPARSSSSRAPTRTRGRGHKR